MVSVYDYEEIPMMVKHKYFKVNPLQKVQSKS